MAKNETRGRKMTSAILPNIGDEAMNAVLWAESLDDRWNFFRFPRGDLIRCNRKRDFASVTRRPKVAEAIDMNLIP